MESWVKVDVVGVGAEEASAEARDCGFRIEEAAAVDVVDVVDVDDVDDDEGRGGTEVEVIRVNEEEDGGGGVAGAAGIADDDDDDDDEGRRDGGID